MLDRQTGGGMALMDGVHMIDRMLWLFGPDVHSVAGMVGNPVHPEIPANDTSLTQIRWSSGMTGVWIGKNEEYAEVDVPQFNSLEQQFKEFVEAVNAGAEPPITATHGRQVIEVMEAMDRSSETGREVLM